MPLAVAQGFKSIQPNRPNSVQYLVFDIDRAGGADAWINADLPPPNVTMTTPNGPRAGRAHIVYVLEDPIYSGAEGHQRPSYYVEAIRSAFTDALGADADYNGGLMKNPLHPYWLTELLHCKTHSLAELHEYVNLKGIQRGHSKVNGVGRNRTLFDDLRPWAYRQKLEFQLSADGYEAFAKAVEAEAHARNRFVDADPLPWKEVCHTAKSVSRWTWKKYSGCGVATPEFIEAQAARGARKGAEKREAGLAFLRAGATVEDIVQEFGVGLATAYRWAKIILNTNKDASYEVQDISGLLTGHLSQYHQVTAKESGVGEVAAGSSEPSIENSSLETSSESSEIVEIGGGIGRLSGGLPLSWRWRWKPGNRKSVKRAPDVGVTLANIFRKQSAHIVSLKVEPL